ncbi:UNVERIFIED_CONTAM: hypothetical protein PYX00_000987 [Menopon gallinae]|uniref:Alpha-catulin n=1 Tax=Menopon gallinae TaxID=328185 RepID=A0AAW2ICH6_9NEOP
MADLKPFELGNTVEIKTKSIEQTLLPLVQQISTLVNIRDRGIVSERNLRAVARVGQAVNLAVERFVTVGETIGDDNPEIKLDMFEACKEAREAGAGIEKLCEMEECLTERGAVVRAARALLASVTRVLLLADIVVVKQLLLVKDKVARSLGRLEGVTNFTEFVKAFSQFGAEMVELAHLTGDRQNDTKDERRRAQMQAARQVLERSTMMLLVSSKTCLRHPECHYARENRDTVFCQMRRAMDLIHYVVKDGVLEPNEINSSEIWETNRTVHGALQRLEGLVQTALLAAHCQEGLSEALDAIIERSQDFTDSANTSHEHRERILDYINSAKMHLDALLNSECAIDGTSPSEETERTVELLLTNLRDLRKQLQETSFAQASELDIVIRHGSSALDGLKNLALAGDMERLEICGDQFSEHTDHILEICKLVRHMAPSDSLQVAAKYTEINIRIYAPQVLTAASTLAMYPTSKIAKENLEVFADMWQALVSDVSMVTKEVIDICKAKELKHGYMSLPRPGKHGTTSKPLKASRLDSEEQAKIAKAGLEMKMMTNEMDAEADKWRQDENNDIVKRARSMSSMAFSMYQFTKGEGTLKTTQDLFTQAEFFAEEANRLYKVARQFSYQVPAGSHKKELLESLSGVPTHVQQLQFTVKDPTVGKAATFTKVDLVIHETKSLMNIISKVVTNCYVCCNKYNIDLTGLGSGNRGISGGDEEGGCGGAGGGGDGKLGTAGGTDPSI